jgi:hypothetical protein
LDEGTYSSNLDLKARRCIARMVLHADTTLPYTNKLYDLYENNRQTKWYRSESFICLALKAVVKK